MVLQRGSYEPPLGGIKKFKNQWFCRGRSYGPPLGGFKKLEKSMVLQGGSYGPPWNPRGCGIVTFKWANKWEAPVSSERVAIC